MACHVSAQGRGRGRGDHGSKPPFQCSNKVDQMKKLKGESQRKSVLKWPHYSRLEFILQGSSQRDTASQGYRIPGGIDAGRVFPPVLDQSSLSSEAGSLVPEGEDTKQPRLLCLQDFQQLFLTSCILHFICLLYCSSSHTFLLVLQNPLKKRNGKFRMRNLILRKKMTTQGNCPCKSSVLHIACWALYQKCQDLEALPPKTEDSSSALPIRATLTLWQAFNLLQILF